MACTGSASMPMKARSFSLLSPNNIDGLPSAMGGEDSTVTIPGVMVSKADGATLKGLAGQSATVRLREPAPLMKDASLDADVVWHEYGHGLTWRMIGGMKGPLAGAIGEGMGDVLAVINNDDPVVGEYSASDPTGIRSASYEGYPGTYGQIWGSSVGTVSGWGYWDIDLAYNITRYPYLLVGEMDNVAPTVCLPPILWVSTSLCMVSSSSMNHLAMPGDSGGPWMNHVYVEDTDATWRRALESGATSLEAPREMPYGDRRAMVRDRWGNTWQIATHGGRFT